MHEGRLVSLVPLRAEDKPLLFEWINDRRNVLWNAAYAPVHETEHDRWFEQLLGRADLKIFGIRNRATGRLVGTCQLHSISTVHRSAELQIRIGAAEQQGKGMGAEAVRLLVDFGFNDLNLERIYLHVFADNARAIAVYEKEGFLREGLARKAAFINGAFQDVVLMGMLRSDHRAHNDSAE